MRKVVCLCFLDDKDLFFGKDMQGDQAAKITSLGQIHNVDLPQPEAKQKERISPSEGLSFV